MYFSKTIAATLITASAVLAVPSLLEGRAVKVGYGEQIQNSDEANHWVVWVEGEDACPAAKTLSRLTTSPCNQKFTLEGEQYKFTNCKVDNEPQAVKDASGNIVRRCTLDSDKINCHDGLHDIQKHGKCL